MSRAIDRQKVINVAYEGYGLTNELMVPLYASHAGLPGGRADIRGQVRADQVRPG